MKYNYLKAQFTWWAHPHLGPPSSSHGCVLLSFLICLCSWVTRNLSCLSHPKSKILKVRTVYSVLPSASYLVSVLYWCAQHWYLENLNMKLVNVDQYMCNLQNQILCLSFYCLCVLPLMAYLFILYKADIVNSNVFRPMRLGQHSRITCLVYSFNKNMVSISHTGKYSHGKMSHFSPLKQ